MDYGSPCNAVYDVAGLPFLLWKSPQNPPAHVFILFFFLLKSSWSHVTPIIGLSIFQILSKNGESCLENDSIEPRCHRQRNEVVREDKIQIIFQRLQSNPDYPIGEVVQPHPKVGIIARPTDRWDRAGPSDKQDVLLRGCGRPVPMRLLLFFPHRGHHRVPVQVLLQYYGQVVRAAVDRLCAWWPRC